MEERLHSKDTHGRAEKRRRDVGDVVMAGLVPTSSKALVPGSMIDRTPAQRQKLPHRFSSPQFGGTRIQRGRHCEPVPFYPSPPLFAMGWQANSSTGEVNSTLHGRCHLSHRTKQRRLSRHQAGQLPEVGSIWPDTPFRVPFPPQKSHTQTPAYCDNRTLAAMDHHSNGHRLPHHRRDELEGVFHKVERLRFGGCTPAMIVSSAKPSKPDLSHFQQPGNLQQQSKTIAHPNASCMDSKDDKGKLMEAFRHVIAVQSKGNEKKSMVNAPLPALPCPNSPGPKSPSTPTNTTHLVSNASISSNIIILPKMPQTASMVNNWEDNPALHTASQTQARAAHPSNASQFPPDGTSTIPANEMREIAPIEHHQHPHGSLDRAGRRIRASAAQRKKMYADYDTSGAIGAFPSNAGAVVSNVGPRPVSSHSLKLLARQSTHESKSTVHVVGCGQTMNSSGSTTSNLKHLVVPESPKSMGQSGSLAGSHNASEPVCVSPRKKRDNLASVNSFSAKETSTSNSGALKALRTKIKDSSGLKPTDTSQITAGTVGAEYDDLQLARQILKCTQKDDAPLTATKSRRKYQGELPDTWQTTIVTGALPHKPFIKVGRIRFYQDGKWCRWHDLRAPLPSDELNPASKNRLSFHSPLCIRLRHGGRVKFWSSMLSEDRRLRVARAMADCKLYRQYGFGPGCVYKEPRVHVLLSSDAAAERSDSKRTLTEGDTGIASDTVIIEDPEKKIIEAVKREAISVKKEYPQPIFVPDAQSTIYKMENVLPVDTTTESLNANTTVISGNQGAETIQQPFNADPSANADAAYQKINENSETSRAEGISLVQAPLTFTDRSYKGTSKEISGESRENVLGLPDDMALSSPRMSRNDCGEIERVERELVKAKLAHMIDFVENNSGGSRLAESQLKNNADFGTHPNGNDHIKERFITNKELKIVTSVPEAGREVTRIPSKENATEERLSNRSPTKHEDHRKTSMVVTSIIKPVATSVLKVGRGKTERNEEVNNDRSTLLRGTTNVDSHSDCPTPTAMRSPGYYYHGIQMKSLPISSVPEVAQLSDQLATLYELPRKQWSIGVDLIIYRDGNDGIAWHADDTQEESIILCVVVESSNSRPRPLKIRSKRKRGEKPKEGDEQIELFPGPGDAYEMDAKMQKRYEHCLPKNGGCTSRRSVLIFRDGRSVPVTDDSGYSLKEKAKEQRGPDSLARGPVVSVDLLAPPKKMQPVNFGHPDLSSKVMEGQAGYSRHDLYSTWAHR
mmetsp:Transcript_17218/g.49908  ORF Transcript_17218/g.49908 Transcript_17218/m.49908 type:complete len:1249 (-) Transcript_17218:777-4523(-)